jgi:hypothetical protein
VELDGDAALPLELVVIEHLLSHLAVVERAGGLEEPVRERRLSVVDMRNDAKVANAIGQQRSSERGNGGRRER